MFLTTEGAVRVTCPFAAHVIDVRVLDGGHAMLFERALQRLADDLPRDAVLDAFTALKMYLSQVPARVRYGREPGVSVSDIREQLQPATGRAEPALRAALAAVSIASGKPPPRIPSRLPNLRNRAVHAGEYPSPKDAEWACLEVERIIRDFEALLVAVKPTDGRPPYSNAVITDAFRQWAEAHSGDDSRHQLSIMMGCVLADGYLGQVQATKRLQDYRDGKDRFLRL